MALSLLSIQSHVVYGHVGNSAAAFALQRLGCEAMPLHTVQFSSHAGYPGYRGQVFDAELIDACVDGLKSVGALARCHGILTGFVGSPAIGEATLRAAQALKGENPSAFHCCDPVFGDEGIGVYAAPGVLEFMRERAVPAANLLTPNAFELERLSGVAATDALSARKALGVLHKRGPRVILATSVRLADTPRDAIDMLVGEGAGLWRLRTPKEPIEVHGAGDLMAALFFYHWLQAASAPQALARAASSVYGVVRATALAGGRELALVAAQGELVAPTLSFSPQPF